MRVRANTDRIERERTVGAAEGGGLDADLGIASGREVLWSVFDA